MRRKLLYICFAALAAGLAGSCNKEVDDGLGAERIITVSGLGTEVAEGALVALSIYGMFGKIATFAKNFTRK